MGKHSAPTPYLIFAAATFLTVAAIATPVVMLRFDAIGDQAERDAAAAASRALAPVLSRAELALFAEVANGLLGDQVGAIRLWGSDGELLAATDASAGAQADRRALARASTGEVAAVKIASTERDLLVSYTPFRPGAILEIQQDYGPVAASVAGSRRDLLIVVGSSVLALSFLLPLIHWLAVRGLRGEYKRLLHLYRAGQAIRSTLDLADVLDHLARDIALFTRARIGLVTLIEEESSELVLKASFEREEDTATQHHRQIEEWFLRRCAATGETVLTQEDRLRYPFLPRVERDQPRPVSILCVAIPGRDRAIGVVMAVRDSTEGAFRAAEIRMVEEMAAQAAMAVEQSVLFAKMRRYANEVEASYDNTLKVLTAALDTKDAATQGHSERVSRLTVAVAKEMGITDRRLVDIERGALLHDIGKIGVPDMVLQKPASLNEQEWEAMQKHPLLAGLMVSKVEFLEGALPILLYHHERYDGSGYPFGLEGSAIPLDARIFTVVDSYDAMTSDRPYRKAMRHEAALREIQRNAGIQFDPRVVQAFMRVTARMQPALKRAS